MSKPFPKLTHLTFSGILKILDFEARLDIKFPKLEKASFVLLGYSGFSYPLLPNLKHLKWHVSSGHEDTIHDIVEKNPQIRSVDLGDLRVSDLTSVNTFLTNLETITISKFSFDFGLLIFPTVTKFNVKDNDFYPNSFSFENLKELSMNCKDKECDRWIPFLESHNNVSRFHIGYAKMDDNQFGRLMNLPHLPNLTELTVEHLESGFLKVETIAAFMKDRGNLLKFSLGTFQQSDKSNFVNNLGKQWKITDDDGCLLFTKTT